MRLNAVNNNIFNEVSLEIYSIRYYQVHCTGYIVICILFVTYLLTEFIRAKITRIIRIDWELIALRIVLRKTWQRNLFTCFSEDEIFKNGSDGVFSKRFVYVTYTKSQVSVQIVNKNLARKTFNFQRWLSEVKRWGYVPIRIVFKACR